MTREEGSDRPVQPYLGLRVRVVNQDSPSCGIQYDVIADKGQGYYLLESKHGVQHKYHRSEFMPVWDQDKEDWSAIT